MPKEPEDISKQKWRLDMDGYEVASLMTALFTFHEDHKDDEDYGLTGEILKGIRPTRIE